MDNKLKQLDFPSTRLALWNAADDKITIIVAL